MFRKLYRKQQNVALWTENFIHPVVNTVELGSEETMEEGRGRHKEQRLVGWKLSRKKDRAACSPTHSF